MILFLTFSLIALAGVSEAVMDKLQFHYDRTNFPQLKNQSFWDPSISWKNKWKEGDPQLGEKFWGSSGIFVALTDAWHLFKSVRTLTLFASLFLAATMTYDFKFALFLFVLLRVAFGLVFSFTFHILERDFRD